jgi:hypothetical protein
MYNSKTVSVQIEQEVDINLGEVLEQIEVEDFINEFDHEEILSHIDQETQFKSLANDTQAAGEALNELDCLEDILSHIDADKFPTSSTMNENNLLELFLNSRKDVNLRSSLKQEFMKEFKEEIMKDVLNKLLNL